MSGGPGVFVGLGNAAVVTLAAGQRRVSGRTADAQRQGSGMGVKNRRCIDRYGLRYILVLRGDLGGTGAIPGRFRGNGRVG